MKPAVFWASYYGLRLDASDEFVQGYVDGMRLDQRGQGVACGKSWIPRSKKCSRDKASQTSKEAKAKTVEKAKARAKLKGEVKAAKGQKARAKVFDKVDPQFVSETKIQRPNLTGSEKQVKWASDLRDKSIEKLFPPDPANSAVRWGGKDREMNATIEYANQFLQSEQGRSARFWIDNRQNVNALKMGAQDMAVKSGVNPSFVDAVISIPDHSISAFPNLHKVASRKIRLTDLRRIP